MDGACRSAGIVWSRFRYGNKNGLKSINSLLICGEPRFISPREEIDLNICADGLLGSDLTVERDFCNRGAESWELQDKRLPMPSVPPKSGGERIGDGLIYENPKSAGVNVGQDETHRWQVFLCGCSSIIFRSRSKPSTSGRRVYIMWWDYRERPHISKRRSIGLVTWSRRIVGSGFGLLGRLSNRADIRQKTRAH